MKRTLAVLVIIIAICAFFFRAYLFGGKLLFPTNLLVAFYNPWNTQHYPGWNNIPFKGLGTDNLLIFYPMKTLLRHALTQHTLPLWTPYNFSGGPLFGDGESAPMYPLTYLYLFPSLPDAFSIMVILVPMLTMLFTYGMLRHFKLSRVGALFGAITFAFCGFMSVWMEENPAVSQSAIWLPLLVWILDLLITQPRRRWFAIFSLLTAVMIASGFLQIVMYELVFLTAFAIFRIMTIPAAGKWRQFYHVALSGIIGCMLVAPYLTTTWEAYRLSPRDFVNVPEIRSIFLVQWSHLLSLFNPDWLGNPGTYNYLGVGTYYDKALFIGVIPLVFVLFGLWTKKSRLENFFWWVTGVTLFLGISSPPAQWLFGLPISILSSMLPSRIFYLSSFALSVIAAIVFDRMQRKEWYETVGGKLRQVIGIYLIIIILLEVFLLAFLTELGIPTFTAGAIAHTIRSAIVSTVQMIPALQSILLRNISISLSLTAFTLFTLYAAYRIKMLRSTVPFFLIFLTIVSAWYFTNKSLYTGERQFVYPANPMIEELRRVAGLDRIGFADSASRIKPAINAVYGLYSIEGLNPVFSYRYGQLIKSAVSGGRLDRDIPRISVELDTKQAFADASAAGRIQQLLSLLDIKYITEYKESAKQKNYDWYTKTYPTHTKIWENDTFRIWKNPDTLPRAFVATTVTVSDNPQHTLDLLYDPNTNVYTDAIVDGPISLPPRTSEISTYNGAVIDSYRMNDVTVTSHATTSGLLVLTDTYAPGWHATVDGKWAPVYRTDFTFRGVPVPSGTHTVFLYYQPESFILGVWILTGGVILFIGCGIFLHPRI
ncbi:MAG: YfhO family protein [Candidatus Gottesmanbacteria bacterium]|nr:YfhO family protein [Candidatus Gottesmanbacteria bacterium]